MATTMNEPLSKVNRASQCHVQERLTRIWLPEDRARHIPVRGVVCHAREIPVVKYMDSASFEEAAPPNIKKSIH